VPGSKTDGILTLFRYFLIFCAALLALGTGGQALRASCIERSWPTVPAQVVDCRIREIVTSKDGHGTYSLRCGFRYVEYVEAISTHNTRSPATVAQMRSWGAAHRRGSVQPIHYDPATPRAISLGEFGQAIDLPLFDETLSGSTGFAAGGLILLLITFWRRSRRRLNNLAA